MAGGAHLLGRGFDKQKRCINTQILALVLVFMKVTIKVGLGAFWNLTF